MISLIFFFSLLGYVLAHPSGHEGLSIKTRTGTIKGTVNETVPGVRQFLSIPYALPPVAERRFMPPKPLPSNSRVEVDATQWPPSCPQYGSRVEGVYTDLMGQNFIRRIHQNTSAGAVVDSTSEDCLYLAVFAPQKVKKKLPVVLFVTGGGFVTGGIEIDMQKPYRWVERTKSHIVVTIKSLPTQHFRMGQSFRHQEENPAMEDMRLAIEWVHENIEAFGGDRDRIVLWGSSAGSRMVEFYSYLPYCDPLVKGYYLDSGSAMSNGSTPIPRAYAASNFTFVASNLGCGGLDAKAELRCMQKLPFQTISRFIGEYQDNSTDVAPTQRQISFLPTDDGETVYSNYTALIAAGRYTRLPIIQSTCANENAALYASGSNYPRDGSWPNQTAVNRGTLQNFLCPVVRLSQLRSQVGAPIYRWQFAANTTTVSPLPWLGAYHGGDLPYLFGSFQDYPGRAPPTRFAFAVSHAVQDHLYAFAQDPVNGLKKIGLPEYSTGRMLRFGGGGRVVQEIDAFELDSVCTENRPWAYNPFP